MVVNLEFIKALVTAEEVLLLDPLRQEVIPFVDQLRKLLAKNSSSQTQGHGDGTVDERENDVNVSRGGKWLPVSEAVEGEQYELPFEFQVLENALEVVCMYLDSSVADLERDAYPVLDELARNVSTKNLEHVRSLKSNLTRILARVQKVCSIPTLSTNSSKMLILITYIQLEIVFCFVCFGGAGGGGLVHVLLKSSLWESLFFPPKFLTVVLNAIRLGETVICAKF